MILRNMLLPRRLSINCAIFNFARALRVQGLRDTDAAGGAIALALCLKKGKESSLYQRVVQTRTITDTRKSHNPLNGKCAKRLFFVLCDHPSFDVTLKTIIPRTAEEILNGK
jgi:hypothetical protein